MSGSSSSSFLAVIRPPFSFSGILLRNTSRPRFHDCRVVDDVLAEGPRRAAQGKADFVGDHVGNAFFGGAIEHTHHHREFERRAMAHRGEQERQAGRVLVGDGAPQHLAEDVGDLVVIQRLATGQRVGNVLVARLAKTRWLPLAGISRVSMKLVRALPTAVDLVPLLDLSL